MATARIRAVPDHPVVALARAKWASSGLTDQQARELLMTGVPGTETQTLARNFHPVNALRIPYFNFDGTPTGFYRIRYLEDVPCAIGSKPMRYHQPIGAINEVYLPPLDCDWEAIRQNRSQPVLLPEGELKAAAATAAGFPAIGLGGVDVWRSQRRGIDFLPQLAEFDWRDRVAYIVFDSDIATKPDVVRAQRTLSEALLARGARPTIVALPPGPNGAKQGLDDFLVANSPAALQELLDTAVEFPESNALWEMNEEVLLVKDPGIVVEKATGRLINPKTFQHVVYANRHFMQATGPKRDKLVKKPLAGHWIQWEQRHEAPSIVYEPGAGRITETGHWNTWEGWGCQPEAGNVAPWHWLMRFLFKGDTAAQLWFERWAAYPLQHPGEKMFTAVVMWSVAHGTGKSFVGYLLGQIYGKNYREIKNQHLSKPFNTWAVNKQFVMGDEITGGKARVDADKMKGMITAPIVEIEEKYLPAYTVKDCINYFLTSNHADAVFIEDNDRRYFVHEVIGAPATLAQYEVVDAWAKAGGAKHLFHYLLNLPLGDFNPRAPAPETAAKRGMLLASKSDLAFWVQRLREDAVNALSPLGHTVATDCNLFTPSNLKRAMDPQGVNQVTPSGIARALMTAGFRQVNSAVPVRTATGLHRLYAIRNGEQWMRAAPRELAAHYDRYFPPV